MNDQLNHQMIATDLKNAGFMTKVYRFNGNPYVKVSLNRRIYTHEVATALDAAGYNDDMVTIKMMLDGGVIVTA